MQTLDLSRILESEDGLAVDGVLVVDAEARIVFFNRRYAEMWGVPEEVLREESDRTLLEFVQSRLVDPQEFLERVAELYANPELEARDELALIDGRRFERFSGPLRNRDGTLYGRVWFFRDVTDQKVREATLRRQLDQLAAVYGMASAIEEAEDVESMTQEAFDTFERLLGADRVALLLANEDDVLRFVAWRGLSDEYRAAIEARSPSLPYVARPEAVSIADVTTDPTFADLAEVVAAEGLRGYAFIPLLHGRRLIGRLVAYFNDPRQLSPDEIQLAQTLARHLSLAVARRQAEDALRLSRDELAAILGGVTDGITVQDPTGRLVYANGAAARLLRAGSPEELVAAAPGELASRFEILTDDGSEFPLEQFPGRRALAGEQPEEVVMRWRHRDGGEERWSVVSTTPVYGDDGRVKLAVNIFRDVTERRRAEERLAFLAEAGDVLNRSLDYGDTLREVARLAVPRVSDWCIVYLAADDGSIERLAVEHFAERSERVRRILEQFKLDPDSSEGVPLVIRTGEPLLQSAATSVDVTRDVDAPDDLASELAELQICSAMIVPLSARGRTFGAISFIAAESGRHFGADDLELAQELARRASTAVDNALLFKEAQESYALLETVIVTAPIAIAFWDRDLRYVRVNDAMAELNGISPEEHVGRSLVDVVPHLAPQLEPLYLRVLETGEPYVHLEQTTAAVPLEPGGERHWLSSYYPVRTVDGEIVGLGAVIVEITERKRAEEERIRLLEAEQEARAEAQRALEELKFQTTLLELQSEASPDGLLVVAPDGAIISFNRRFVELWGMPDEVVAAGSDEAALAYALEQVEDPEAFIAGVRGFYANPIPERVELRLRDGRVFERYGAPVRGADGAEYGFLWSFRDITERRRAEIERQRAEERFRTLLAASTTIIWTTAADGTFEERSPSWEAYTGQAPDAYLGPEWGWLDAIHEGDRERVRTAWRRAVQSNEPVETTYRLRRADGEHRRVVVSAAPVLEPDGTVREWIGSNSDVEAEHRAHERVAFLAAAGAALSSSLDFEQTLSNVVELAVPALADWCAVDVVDEDDGALRRVAVQHVDPAKVELARELERRWPATTAAHAGPGAVVRTGVSELAEVSDELLVAVAQDAEHLEVLRTIGFSSYVCVPLSVRGKTIGALTLITAESRRILSQADLELAEELARRAAAAVDNARLFHEAEERAQAARVLDAVGDGVFLVDAGGIVRLWNPAAEQVTGLRRDAVVGRPAAEAIPGWTRAQPLVPVADWPQAAAMHAETVPLDVGSRELWLSISGVGFADGTVYAFRDLTEERTVEQLKSDFVSTVSHELRTPLAAIYGAALTLGRSELQLEQEQQRRLLDVIAGEADRLARTVNDILWASRLDSGQLHVTIESCDAVALAGTVVAAQRTHLPPNITVVYDPPEGVPPVRADADKLRQVLTNLLDNAVKYSPDGGRVDVRVEQTGSRVRFSVRDQGLGIPLTEQDRIFEKFYRLDPQLTRGVGGTGLGLYICRELVRRMEGRLWLYSLPGEGSTFFVELPLV